MASAATWQSAIAVPSTVEYDSNPLLLTSDEEGVTRTIIAPDYSLVGTSGPDEYRFGLGGEYRAFVGYVDRFGP